MAWLFATVAQAHDSTESTAVARLQHGRLEMVGSVRPRFASDQPRLLAKEAGLFDVRVDGVPLVPTPQSGRAACPI